ncbi:MAG: hypothetical protein NTV80_19210 [Verrucomicrobia bacterium]|nr:hypothetical protein [Verrucomicrobiota bacterium]
MNTQPFLVSLLVAAMVANTLPGAEPVQVKAVKPLRTYHDFIAVIPKDLEPEQARNWSEAQKEVANGILKKKLVDTKRPAVMRFKVHGVDFWGRFVLWTHLPADEGYSIRVFASQWKDPNPLPKLASLREGDLIEMSGECDLAKFENLWNTKSLTLGIANASFIKLQRNGKPAPPTGRIPVGLISAVYGSGTAFADVTDRVKALLEEPSASFKANPNWLGADPTPGWNKALIIVYQINGQRRTFTAGENGEVSAALLSAQP